MNGTLLDTHTWLWFVTGEPTLAKTARAQINEAIQQEALFLAAISLWEVAMLEARGRIQFELPISEWLKKAIELPRLTVASLSPEIAVESCRLPGEFHGDPADRLIVATARLESLTLLTRDKNILRYARKGHVHADKA